MRRVLSILAGKRPGCRAGASIAVAAFEHAPAQPAQVQVEGEVRQVRPELCLGRIGEVG